jgi:hypothetical protein
MYDSFQSISGSAACLAGLGYSICRILYSINFLSDAPWHIHLSKSYVYANSPCKYYYVRHLIIPLSY